MDGSVAAELEAAERVGMRWYSTALGSSAGGDEQILFDGGADRSVAERFLRAVDELRRLASLSPTADGSPRRASTVGGGGGGGSAVQVAMARLEDEFRHVLSSRALDLEVEALAGLCSLSLSDATDVGDDDDSSVSSSVGRRSSYRSMLNIREIDLFRMDVINDLRAIASCMAAAGYCRECVTVYGSVRKPVVDSALRRLGVEKLSIGDVQRLDWDVLEAKIRRWIRAARAAVRGLFASE
jgi:exocyst complex component 7